MKWRVVLELVGPDGTVVVHEVCGRAAVGEYVPRMIGLTLAEGKHLLAALQVHLVQAQAEDHCHRRRRYPRCGAQRPLKDQRSRRLVSLFGTVTVCSISAEGSALLPASAETIAALCTRVSSDRLGSPHDLFKMVTLSSCFGPKRSAFRTTGRLIGWVSQLNVKAQPQA